MARVKIFSVLSIILFTFSLFSCKDDTVTRRKISGKAGELIIVVPKETWNGRAGEAMKKVLMQPQIGLPQNEPLFSAINIPPAAFKEIFKTHRNIINVYISPTLDSARVEFKEDVWAWPQAVVNIHAKSTDEFIELFNAHSDRVLAFMLKAERDRLQLNYAKYNDKKIKAILREKFDIAFSVPTGFNVAVNKENFLWVRYDTPEITQGIAVYSFPYKSDSTFTADYLLNIRDSVLKEHIAGPLAGSYMSTEHQVPPFFKIMRYKKNYAAEMRGLWKTEKDFMGGPFINLTVLDIANNRVIVLDGFVYAPRFDKRNYLRQVEAMIYSLELADQAKNDKINSEIQMGN
ncbi:MAG: DUF4837 family protein [Prolixibacteraceae bacterium]